MRLNLLPFVLMPALAALPVLAEPRVVVDTAPVHALAAAIMAGVAEPTLVGAGQDPHALALRPSDMLALTRADLLIWTGPAMTPWVGELAGSTSGPVVRLDQLAGLAQRPPLFGGGEDRDDAEAGHDHGGQVDDPHLWLDPANARVMAQAIAAALVRVDPANAGRYQAELQRLEAELQHLTDELSQQLAPWQALPIVSTHDAYAHLAGAFGLNFVGAGGNFAAQSGGAGHLADLSQAMQAGAVGCVLAEAGHPGHPVEAIAADAGVPVAWADPEGLRLSPGLGLYAALMRGLADAIAGCAAP